MPLGHPGVVRANYVDFKLWKEMHALWIQMKCSLGSKSMVCWLVIYVLDTTVTASNKRNSMEVNDLN